LAGKNVFLEVEMERHVVQKMMDALSGIEAAARKHEATIFEFGPISIEPSESGVKARVIVSIEPTKPHVATESAGLDP
jgi:hypothetical protein